MDVVDSLEEATLTKDVAVTPKASMHSSGGSVPNTRCHFKSGHPSDHQRDIPAATKFTTIKRPTNEPDKPATTTGLLSGDGPSENGQCNPPWWEVLDMVRLSLSKYLHYHKLYLLDQARSSELRWNRTVPGVGDQEWSGVQRDNQQEAKT